MPTYLVTLAVEEFVPEGGVVLDVIYFEDEEVIRVEYEMPEKKP